LYRTYATPLQLDIQSSRQLALLLAVIGALVVISLLIVSFIFYLNILFLFLFLSLVFINYKNINIEKIIVWKEGNKWEITEEGVSINASLLASSFVSQWLTVLNFKLDNKQSKTVLVFTDAIHQDQFRRLRVRLKVDGI
jgi:hypothetical protein